MKQHFLLFINLISIRKQQTHRDCVVRLIRFELCGSLKIAFGIRVLSKLSVGHTANQIERSRTGNFGLIPVEDTDTASFSLCVRGTRWQDPNSFFPHSA